MADEILLILSNKQESIVDRYLKTVAKGKLQKYRASAQTGIRQGHDLYSHLIRGSLLLHSLGSLFQYSDEDIRLLMAAFSIHDLNKLYEPGGKSLRKLVDDRAFLEQVIRDSGVAEFLPEWQEVFADLKQLILGHGGHTTVAGERLLAEIEGSRIGKTHLEALTFLMRAVDISDLSQRFEERKFKDKFLLEINSVGVKQYRLISYRLGEHRGVLSNIIHNSAREVLEKEYTATAVLLYPEGTWYLVPSGASLPDRSVFHQKVSAAVQRSLGKIRSQDLSKIVSLTKDGVKTDPSLFRLGLDAPEIVTEITKQVFRRRFDPRKIEGERQKCAGRLQRKSSINIEIYCNEHRISYPQTEDLMRAGELLRALYNLIKTHFSKQAVLLTNGEDDPWSSLYILLGIDGAVFEPFDKLYDRPFVVAGTLKKAYSNLEQEVENILSRLLDVNLNVKQGKGNSAPPDFLTSYLGHILDVDFAPRPASDLAAYFSSYVAQNHKQCCYSASVAQAESWMSAEVPKGIVVQQFSNRLEGGVKREPKRNICPVCREQFFLEQMLFRSGGAKGMYLHFFPRGSLPAVYMETLRSSLEELAQKADPDTFFLPTENSLADRQDTNLELHLLSQKARGFAVPKRSEAIGNTITLSICPGVRESRDGRRILQSVEIGLRLGKLLGLRCIVSESPIPPIGPQQFDAFYIDTIPSALQGFFGQKNLSFSQTDALLERYTALRIVDREVRSGFDSIDWDLAQALGVTPLAIFAVAGRALERKLRSSKAAAPEVLASPIRTRLTEILEILAYGGKTMAEQAVSTRLKTMAKLAAEHTLRGSSFKRNSLLDPLTLAFDRLRRKSEPLDLDAVQAATSQAIFDRIERLADPQYKPGAAKHEKITRFVAVFYDLLRESYGNSFARFLSDEKSLKEAYLFYLNAALQDKREERNNTKEAINAESPE